jgi:hypothetical protein
MEQQIKYCTDTQIGEARRKIGPDTLEVGDR